MKVSVSKIALNLKQAIAASLTFENDFEVLRRCFREFVGQFRFAIAVPLGQQPRHEATTFLSLITNTDLHLENEKPFTKGMFEPLVRIIEPSKRGKQKPLLRFIQPRQRMIASVIDR